MIRRRAAFGALLALLLVLVVGAAPAGAHASLERTTPASGASLASPPTRITLVFSEAVEVGGGSIRVYAASGDRVDEQRARHGATNREVDLALPRLRDGTYIVTWRVISADSHPVHGAFTFTVGRGGDASSSTSTDALAKKLVAGDAGSRTVGITYGVVRFIGFIALLLVIGMPLVLELVWREGWRRRSIRRTVLLAWIVALVATKAGIVLQGAYGAGLGLGGIFKPSVWADVLATRFGKTWFRRAFLLLMAAPFLVAIARRPPGQDPRRTRTREIGLAVAGLAILFLTAKSGHASTDSIPALALTLDTAHLAAASLWFGGLVVLTLGLRPAHDDDEDPPVTGVAGAAARFSPLAFGAVIVILATGLTAGWRQSQSVAAVTGTPYGRFVLAKLAVFAAMVAIAATSRAWVRRTRAADTADLVGAPLLAKLRRSVGAEAVLGVVILGLTSFLVNAVPAKTALAQPLSIELTTAGPLIDLTIDPAKAGLLDIHGYTLSPTGAVAEAEEFTVRMSLPAQGIGPIDVPMRRAGPGHFAAYGFTVPIPGRWTVQVTARTSDIDAYSASTKVRIR